MGEGRQKGPSNKGQTQPPFSFVLHGGPWLTRESHLLSQGRRKLMYKGVSQCPSSSPAVEAKHQGPPLLSHSEVTSPRPCRQPINWQRRQETSHSQREGAQTSHAVQTWLPPNPPVTPTDRFCVLTLCCTHPKHPRPTALGLAWVYKGEQQDVTELPAKLFLQNAH